MSTTALLEWVIALGVGAILAEVVRSAFQRRKMGADAAKIITEAATSLLGPLRSRIAELEALVLETRHELESARQEVVLASADLAKARREISDLRAAREESP